MARLQFCDYHNMVAILEKSEHNADFHPIVDFIEASPLRIETTKEGTQILATVDGVLRTVTESSLRRNLKLQDEEGISSFPDTVLFENLTLMGYNISPNQKFTFQKGFNEFSSNIAAALICLAINRTYNFSKMIFDSLVKNINNKVSKFLVYPRQYTRRARIAQSFALPPVADEPTSPVRDVSEGEACPTDSGFIADQDRATIAKSSTLPHDSAPRVTSHAAIEGNDAPNKGRRIDEVERISSDSEKIRMDEGEVAVERTSKETEEMATVLTSMDAATVLAWGINVPTGSVTIPTAGPPVVNIHTGNDVVPTASPIVATATVITPYSRRKGKEVMSQQRRPWTKKQKKDYYMSVIRSNLGWKEEAERLKRKGFNLEQEEAKKQKTSEEVHIEGQRSYWKIIRLGGSSACYQFFVDLLKHLDREDLNQLWVLVKEYLSMKPASNEKEMELWVELKRLYEPDPEDQLRIKMPLPEDCTAIEEKKKKLPVKD
nr:hypothetical protein [Tanacetum cinerariifolium]